MGHIFTYNEAKSQEEWFKNPENAVISAHEKELIKNMLDPVAGAAALDIGCGIGRSLMALRDMGLNVTGIDPSPHMLEFAEKNLKNTADLYRGFAEDLPFDDNSFNYACLINTLEFVDNPRKALEESFRVAKDKVFIGIWNRHSIRITRLRIQKIFTRNIFMDANFFTIWKVKTMVKSLLGDVPVKWKSTGRFSGPLGPFVGISIVLKPRFKTRPLSLKCSPKPLAGPMACSASVKMEAK